MRTTDGRPYKGRREHGGVNFVLGEWTVEDACPYKV